jgi:hypothetical protein
MIQEMYNYRIGLIEDISKQKKLIVGETISAEEFDFLYDLSIQELKDLLTIGDKILQEIIPYEEI